MNGQSSPLRVTCLFGRMAGVAVPGDPTAWLYGDDDIPALFSKASDGKVSMKVKASLEKDLNPDVREVQALDLHRALGTLTGNDTTSGPVSSIGVVFAPLFQNREQVLGMMFDRGFVTSDDSNASFMAVPREGCAVFVNAIKKLRQDVPELVDQELRFTTMHELGHVFNLEHMEDRLTHPHNFMRSSQSEAPHGSSHYRFVDDHCSFLSQAPVQTCIMPGGTKYGDREALGASFDPAQVGNVVLRSKSLDHLRLKASLSSRSFWYCEPVELEVTLSLPKSAHRGCRVLDRLDAGYGEFSIWIEEPDGCRKKYRSPKFFCTLPSYLQLDPGTSFRRDISIFGQSGGFTFRKTGMHRLWVHFALSPGRVLKSNETEFEVRRPSVSDRLFVKLEPLLRRQAKFLYYRTFRNIPRSEKDVAEIQRLVPSSNTAAAASYALGRAYAAHTRRLSSRSQQLETATRAISNLEAAVEHEELAAHSRARAREVLARVKDFTPVNKPKMRRPTQ